MRVILVKVHIPTSWRGKIIPEGLRRQLYEILNAIAAKTSVGWVVLVSPNDPMFTALQTLVDRISARVSEAARAGSIPYSVGNPVSIMAADLDDEMLRNDLMKWAEHLRNKIEEYSKKTYPTAMLRIAEAQRALELIQQFMNKLGGSAAATPPPPSAMPVSLEREVEEAAAPEVPEFIEFEQ